MCQLRIFMALLLLPASMPPATAGIKVGLRQFTSNGNPHHLAVSYKSTGDFLPAGTSTWNSQVLTLRWPVAQGADAVGEVSNLAVFAFEKDGEVQAGGDGHYYQKFTAPATNVSLGLGNGEALDVLLLALNFTGLAGWTFELVTSPNAWVQQNHGKANVENATVGEQFLAFAPAAASYFQLPVDIRFVRAPAAMDHMDLTWEASNGHLVAVYEVLRSEDGVDYAVVGELAACDRFPAPVHCLYEDWDVVPGVGYHYRVRGLAEDGREVLSKAEFLHFLPLGGASPAVYPNPAPPGTVWLRWPAGPGKSVLVTVHAGGGARVLARQLHISPAEQHLGLDLGALPCGAYVLHATDGQLSFVERILLVE